MVWLNWLYISILRFNLNYFSDTACNHVEGGIYIGPEFLLGEVYDGNIVTESEKREIAPLFRPMYITVVRSSQQASSRAADKRKWIYILFNLMFTPCAKVVKCFRFFLVPSSGKLIFKF